MDQAPKQERSRKRIEVILTTAENILLDEGIDSVTIANISEVSGLKRKYQIRAVSIFRLLAQI